MTDKTISPLRRRMIEDMTVRHFTSKTQSDYIRAVTNLARFLRRSLTDNFRIINPKDFRVVT